MAPDFVLVGETHFRERIAAMTSGSRSVFMGHVPTVGRSIQAAPAAELVARA
jgi:hypothetical protein